MVSHAAAIGTLPPTPASDAPAALELALDRARLALKHGTRGCYVSGCRCEACRRANARYYHERKRLARELEADLEIEDAGPTGQKWRAPDGSRKTRFYARGCPGLAGAGCPFRAHLRRDSGKVCQRCRDRLAWNGLVTAGPVRAHLKRLSRAGVGYKSVAAAADVGKTLLAKILSGRKTRLRAMVARRILQITAAAVADHALVDARPTWRRIDRLLEEGFTRGALARRLGMKRPALQLGKDRVLARTAMKVEKLYHIVMVL